MVNYDPVIKLVNMYLYIYLFINLYIYISRRAVYSSVVHYTTRHDALQMLYLDEIPLGSYKLRPIFGAYSSTPNK